MSLLAEKIAHETRLSQVSNISANARVDYIMRFSKHLVIVIDDNVENYSKISSTFLASLSIDENAAFISVSNQTKNIQIRSRIIEQLFPGKLFDPELSLAVSLVSFLKESPQKVSITIEHGQFLSLQIIHELAQFAEIAKKIKYNAKVLISGTRQIGLILNTNRELFKDKISIVLAETGHIVPLNSRLFKNNVLLAMFRGTLKPVLALCALIAVCALIVFYLAKQDLFSFSQLPEKQTPLLIEAKPEVFVLSNTNNQEKINYATAADITDALLFPDETLAASQVKPISYAKNSDILSALEAANKAATVEQVFNEPQTEIKEKTAANKQLVDKPDEKTKPVNNKLTLDKDAIAIYQQHDSGFVIQFGLFFGQAGIVEKFKTDHPNLAYLSYIRLMNNKPYTAITSMPYATKEAAQAALAQLPEKLQVMNLWIKSISLINIEIKQVQSSQF